MRKTPFFVRSDTWALGFGYWTEAKGFELYLGPWVLCFYDEI